MASLLGIEPDLDEQQALKKALKAIEPLSLCKERRLKVSKAMTDYGVGDPSTLERCSKGHRCRDGCCPVCIRLLRRRLLRFAVFAGLCRRDWYFATIFVEGWRKPSGDFSAFGKLRNHRLIENLKRQLRRTAEGDLVVIGSIETEYQTVDNEPRGKPFHLHLMITGATAQTIKKAVRTSLPLDRAVGQAFQSKAVPARPKDILSCLGYVLKQPFWKKSKSEKMTKAARQWPRPVELAELIGNIGVHGWSGRLILIGLDFRGGEFRLTAKLSSTSS